MDNRVIHEEQLLKLLKAAAFTSYGKEYSFLDINSYKEFSSTLPVVTYAEISKTVQKIKENPNNPFWPDQTTKFAVSSGTTDDGKHLPITTARVKADRIFMQAVITNYLRQRPNIFRLWGKHLSLPGTLEKHNNITIGEISAFTARQAPGLLSPFQLIGLKELTNLPFEQKIDNVINRALDSDIRVITAAPSWVLTIFQAVLARTKANSISEVWPNLQLLVCGGLKLDNYRNQLNQLIQKPETDFVETYGASEGYFAFSDDLQRNDLKLVTDNGIFYEFIPYQPDSEDSQTQTIRPIPLWEVETNVLYEMIVTTCAGLWRYRVNDIIQFTQTDPPRIEVMGRASMMLDQFGEAIHHPEAQRAVRHATQEFGLKLCTFTLGALLDNPHATPKHWWFLQLADADHSQPDLDALSQAIDDQLCAINRHYAIRRQSGALDMPEVRPISQSQINKWIKKRKNRKAQTTLPPFLTNDEDIRFFM